MRVLSDKQVDKILTHVEETRILYPVEFAFTPHTARIFHQDKTLTLLM